jgi:hypothetical protein
MERAIRNEDALTQQARDRITLSAPQKLLTRFGQQKLVRLRSHQHNTRKAGKWKPERITHCLM